MKHGAMQKEECRLHVEKLLMRIVCRAILMRGIKKRNSGKEFSTEKEERTCQ